MGYAAKCMKWGLWWYDDDDDDDGWYDVDDGGTGTCERDVFEGRGNDRRMSSVEGNVFGGTGGGISVSVASTATGRGFGGNDGAAPFDEYPTESGVRGREELSEVDSGLDGVSSGQGTSGARWS